MAEGKDFYEFVCVFDVAVLWLLPYLNTSKACGLKILSQLLPIICKQIEVGMFNCWLLQVVSFSVLRENFVNYCEL